MTLTALPSLHDLPPAWDGRPVTWGPWRETRTSLVFHTSPQDQACTACGLIGEPDIALGTVPPDPGETVDVPNIRTLRSGRTYQSGMKAIPAWPVVCLVAFRCTGCGHDTVLDQRTDETWDLDPDDYGPDGSTGPAGSLW